MQTPFTKLGLARRLRLQQLAILDRILACGSLLAAARELHMTQPALTKAIHELEEHFGQALLIRSSRGVQPTAFGRMLAGHTDALMANLRLLADDLNAWHSGISGQVVVGSMVAASAQLLPQTIARLKEIAPNIGVQVRVGVNDKMLPELARGETDIVVGLIPAGPAAGLASTVLYEETCCAAVGRHHQLATARHVSPAQLQDMTWIVPSQDSEASHAVTHFFGQLHMQRPASTIESMSILTNINMLMESDMIALMPFTVARKFVHMGLLSILPLRQSVPFGQIGYTVATNRPPSPAAQRFLLTLQQVATDA